MVVTLDIILSHGQRFEIHISNLKEALSPTFNHLIPKDAEVKIWHNNVQFTNKNLDTQYKQLVEKFKHEII